MRAHVTTSLARVEGRGRVSLVGDNHSREPYTNRGTSVCKPSNDPAVGSHVDEQWERNKCAGDLIAHRGFRLTKMYRSKLCPTQTKSIYAKSLSHQLYRPSGSDHVRHHLETFPSSCVVVQPWRYVEDLVRVIVIIQCSSQSESLLLSSSSTPVRVLLHWPS